jgi:hypothetical protein
MKILRADQRMLAIIWCRIFCLPVCYQKIKFKINRTITMPVIFHASGTWSLTLLWECRLRVFKNRVLRSIFEPKDKVNRSGEDYITRSLVICTPHQIFCRISNQE